MHTVNTRRFWRVLPWAAAIILLTWTAAAAFAQGAPQEMDPPGRVATLTFRQGSIVFSPDGEEEWVELPRNRPLTTGDRLWSDSGARAEVHLGSATLHVDSESHVGITSLDDRSAQFILMQGSVNARVRELAPGENFEIGTPNIALRASQPGDFRIDVDADGRETRVVVLSGMAIAYGEGGESVSLGGGQQATFAGRYLARVQGPAYRGDQFAQWAGERNRAEDLSVAARHVPRGVVGYQQLDQHGTWSQDANHGAIWYPRVQVVDWAPYRHGRWEWVGPWGWTWIDDAPWGFAPFHYGRWAQIGSRWAWVPGALVARPLYSPALVVFLGGADMRGSTGPDVGWYPLAPGEAWYPWYHSSPRYLNVVNININLGAYPRHYDNHRHRHWTTVVREDDFRHGRDVRHDWRRVQPSVFGQARIGAVPERPERHFQRETTVVPHLQTAPRVGLQQQIPGRLWGHREPLVPQQVAPQQVAPQQVAPQQVAPQQVAPQVIQQQSRFAAQLQNAVREQERVRREQERAQGEQERAQREQKWLQWGAQHNAREQQRQQHEQAVRGMQEQERAQREHKRLQWETQRNAREQQRQQHEQAARGVQEQQARAQQEALRQQQEAVRQQQEAVRAQQQERAMRLRAQEPRTVVQQPPAPQQAVPIGREEERKHPGLRRWQRDHKDEGRGRGEASR